MSVDAHGHVPIKDEQYKLLVNNCFTPHEIGVMLSCLGGNLRIFLNRKDKQNLKHQIDCASSAIGKLLLALPEAHKQGIITMFKKELNLEFNIHEVQQPDKEHIQ